MPHLNRRQFLLAGAILAATPLLPQVVPVASSSRTLLGVQRIPVSADCLSFKRVLVREPGRMVIRTTSGGLWLYNVEIKGSGVIALQQSIGRRLLPDRDYELPEVTAAEGTRLNITLNYAYLPLSSSLHAIELWG